MYVQTPILWSHGMADRTVLFEAGQAGPPFLVDVGVSCEFKVIHPDIAIFFINSCLICLGLLKIFYSQAYPGLDHSISNEELRYLESWIKTRMPGSS